MYGMGEEEFKKCLESLGYVSEKESDSNFEETKSECDELYEKYKPPPRKIDPKKCKIIILNENGGSELSLNSNIVKNGKKKRNRKRKKKKKKSSATMDVTSENKPGCHSDPCYFQKELAPLVCDTSNLKDVDYALENTIFSINCYYYFLRQHINYSYYLDENIRMLSETNSTNNENNFCGTMGSSLTLNYLENYGTTVQDENNQCLHTLEYSKNCELSALSSHAYTVVPESPKNLSHIQLYNYIMENMTLYGNFFCDITYQFIQISKYLKKYDCDELSNDAHSLHKWFENFNQVHLSNNTITRDMTSDRKYLYYTDQNMANLSKYCEFSALSAICHSLMLTGLYENFSHIQLSNTVIENVTVDIKCLSETNHNESDQLIKITENSKNWALSSDVNPLISSGSVESLNHIELSSATIEDMTSERKYFYGSYSSTSWYDFQSAYLNEDMLSLITKKTIKSTEITKNSGLSNGGNPLISFESVDSLNHIELSSATVEDMTSERKYFYGSYSSASWYDFQSAYLNEDTSSLVTRKKDNKSCIIRKTKTPKVQILEATENNNFDISCHQYLTNDWRVVNLIAGYLILRLILPWILTCVIYIFDKTIDIIVLIFLLLYLSVIFVTKY